MNEAPPNSTAATRESPSRQETPTDGRIETRVLSGAGVFVLMRLVYLGFPNLLPEEAYYWNYAKHLDYGYLDHPPMVAWLIAGGTWLCGDREFGVRLFAFVSSLAATFFVYRLTAFLYDRRAAALAALLMQALPIFFLTGFVMTPDAPLTACWAGGLYFLARVFFGHRAAGWWGVGICLGLGMLSKYTVALLGPSALVFMVYDREARPWLRRAGPYVAALLALLVFSPVIAWNQAHHWASFAFQSANRIREPRRFSLHELAASVLVLLTPLGAWGAGQILLGPDGLAPKAGSFPRDVASGQIRPDRRLLFIRVFTLVPLSVFVTFSLVHRVKLNWTGPLWLAIVPPLAAQVASMLSDAARPWLRRGWQATVAVCGALYLGTLQHLAFGIPGLPYTAKIELLPVGWSEMGKQVEHEAADLRRAAAPGVRVRAVGMDRNFIASEVAFYHSQPAVAAHETSGGHLFGKISLMYSYWFPSRTEDGETLLLVSFTRHSLERPGLLAQSVPLGKIKPHWLIHRGRPIRRYYTQAVANYRSTVPQP